MSATQRTKRKAIGRTVFDDDDALPAKKKSKVVIESQAQNGQSNGRTTRRKKQVYEEEVDGFAFRRKNAKAKQVEESPAQILIPTSTRAQTASRHSPTVPKPIEAPKETRRRSARLSAESTSPQQQLQTEPVKKRTTRKATDSRREPAAETGSKHDEFADQGLQVSKARSKGTTIVLPFADTPVIKRNKEMRAAHGKRNSSSNRRSSAGLRGRRASSLIDSGTSNAMPHADVDTAIFYKLIEQSLPERGRMRHLLMWCATRALLDKSRPAARQSTIETIAIESARQIQEELIKDFSAKEELSDWWSRSEATAEPIPKKPNPRNVRNLEKLQELEAEVQRLESEEDAWKTLLEPSTSDKTSQQAISGSSSPIDTTLISQTQAELYAILESSKLTTEPFSSALNTYTTSLEPSVDAFADGIHRLTTYATSSAKLADRIKRAWAERLERRDEEARKAAGSDGVAGRDVLRALAGRLNAG